MRSVFQQFLLIPLCAVLVGAAPPKPGPASEAQDLCSQLVTIVGQAIREATLRAPSLKTPAANPWAPPTTISLMKPDDCVASATRLSTLKTMGEYLTPKDAKILVLLPLSGASADWGNAILKGLRQAFTDDNINLDTDALIIDTQSNGDTIERKFLETALTRPILATIGGATRGESERLGRWAGRLLMPTILFSPPALAGLPVAASKYIFRVGPSEADLARTLALKADHRRWKRIAVLRPSGGKSDGIIAQLQAELKSLNIESTIDVPYASIDYKTMQTAVDQLFQIDLVKRREEYDALVKTLQEKATKEGTAFNAKNVFLPPKIDFDAVFIPDDYRIVRHFARLFKFVGATGVPLMGNHEWRSAALVNPPEPLLQNSVFADFLGTYESLPQPLRPQTLGGPYFANPSQVMATDGGIIGYRAGDILRLALRQSEPLKLRTVLLRRFRELQGSKLPMFKNLPAFGPAGQNRWPATIFNVSSHHIAPE